MRLIDFHTHVFPDKIAQKTIDMLAVRGNIPAFGDGTLRGLQTQLESVNAYMGISLPVLTPVVSFDSIMRFAAKINEGYYRGEHNVYSFIGMHPDCEDIEGKMAKIKENGFKGVKIHPDYQDRFIDDPGYIRILNAAIDEDLIVVSHAGIDVGVPDCVHCAPERVAKVLDVLKGDAKFVLAHYGACGMYEETYKWLAGRNVYFDTAYILPEVGKEWFVKILEKHGEDKILFASDCPWQNIKTSLEVLQSFELGKQTEEKILYKNALRLLGEDLVLKKQSNN